MLDQILSRIDLLGIPIILNFSKAKKVRSSFGGLWTLAFLAFVLWLLWSNGAELWQKKKPTVNQGVNFATKARPLELDSETFPMMVYIQYYSTGPTDPANDVVCDFSYLLQTSSDSNGINGTWIDMEPCTKDHFADFVEDGGIIDSETENRITYSYCLPQKSYGSVYGFSLSVSCDDQTGIDEFFDDDPTIEIYYPKYGLSLQNYSYPIQPYLFNYETGIKQEITTYSYWNINYLDITTDHGWLATSEKTEHFVQVAPALNPEVTLSGWNENVFVFSISKEEIYYTRTYTKIQNVLAAVGGLAGSILAVLLIVITPFARVKLSEAFVNEMFELRAEQEQAAQTLDEQQNDQKSGMNTAKVANYPLDAKGAIKDNIQGVEMVNRDGKDQESSPFMKAQSPVDQYKNDETAIQKESQHLPPIQSPLRTEGNGEKNDIEAQQGRNSNQVIAEEEEQQRRLRKDGVFGTMQLALPTKPKKIKKQKIIKITFFEYLASFIYKSPGLKAKMKIINEGLEMLDNRLDVFNLMKKMRDIDKMKGLILNKEQSFLFDRAARPNIKKRSNHWYQEDYGTDYEIFKTANQLEELEMQSLMKETQRMIQNKPQKSEVDQRILEIYQKHYDY